jgi:hypothetical protein
MLRSPRTCNTLVTRKSGNHDPGKVATPAARD